MSLAAAAIQAFEAAPVPDVLRRRAVALLVGGARRRLDRAGDIDAQFAAEMASHPIAEFTAAANTQHYELPAAFFEAVLGPRLKYSCCLYGAGDSLGQAEERALSETAAHADLHDGQDVLELGCGWGSLTLWMAERFPASRITAVSNSAPQRRFIEARAAAQGLSNVRVVTADMNVFDTEARFDRIVSVEMFEHMSNWRGLLARARTWLRPDGALFVHVFSHGSTPYRFDVADRSDWIAQHFFTGGVMPSHGLMFEFPDLFEVEADWRWGGRNYQKTADDWLRRYDAATDVIVPLLRDVYGRKDWVWGRRWRLFFLSVAGLFGDSGGTVWGVSHYRLRRAA